MRFWVPTIVFAAMLAAVLAFNTASPSGGVGVSAPVSPVLEGLQRAALDEWVAGVSRAYAERIQVRDARASARKAATMWLGSLADPGPSSQASGEGVGAVPRVSAQVGPSAKAGIAAFGEWAAGLPVRLVVINVSNVGWKGQPGRSPAIVSGTVGVELLQALKRTRTVERVVVVEMAPTLQGDEVTAWRVTGVRSTRRGLGTLGAPIVVEREGVTVLAERDDRELADRVAQEAARSLPLVRERFAGISGPRVVGVYLLRDTGDAPALTGEQATSPGTHAVGWVLGGGDMVLDAGKLEDVPPEQQAGTVRHEATHVVTLPLSKQAPTLILEGIAVREEDRLVGASGSSFLDLTTLRNAFREGSLGYDELLHSDDVTFGRTSEADIQLGYLAGFATIGYLERSHGNGRVLELLRALRGGASIEEALAGSVDLTPAQLQRGVRRFTADYVRLHPSGSVG